MLGVLGKYRLDTRLGGGGMAEVFIASIQGAEGFSRRVAIKRVLPGYSENPQFSQMFVAEAQISSRMQHPNIVSVLDFDRDHEGRLFLVMELIEGKDLDALLTTGLLPFSVVIYVMTEMLKGLGYAHDLPAGNDDMRGIVHRDVSPHNVLLSWEGAVKVSDFGIAKAREASEATASVFIKGKPAYMSPEQANGEPLDGRSDLFAVGVMMWEMLVGRRLFVGGDTRSLLAQVLFSPIPRPRQQRADVPRDLDRICMKLLERELPARYTSGEEVVEDLLRCEDAPRGGSKELVTLLAQRFGAEVPQRSSKRLAARAPSNLESAMVTPLPFKPVAPGQPSQGVPSTQLGHGASAGPLGGSHGIPGSMGGPVAGAMPSAMGMAPGSYGAEGPYGAPGSVDQMMSAHTRTLPPSGPSTATAPAASIGHPPRRGISTGAIIAAVVGGLVVAGAVLGVVLSEKSGGGTNAVDAGFVATGTGSGSTATGGGAPKAADAGMIATQPPGPPPGPDGGAAVAPLQPDAGGTGGAGGDEKPDTSPSRKRGKGKLTITSQNIPYEVFAKGKSLGGTPIKDKELEAGTYRLRFVSGDGDEMYRTVKIEAGKESKLSL
jgi:eukaryotic-like serine/threonine-protein kinase